MSQTSMNTMEYDPTFPTLRSIFPKETYTDFPFDPQKLRKVQESETESGWEEIMWRQVMTESD